MKEKLQSRKLWVFIFLIGILPSALCEELIPSYLLEEVVWLPKDYQPVNSYMLLSDYNHFFKV